MCCEEPPRFTTPNPTTKTQSSSPKKSELPELSLSVNTVASDEEEQVDTDRQTQSEPLDIKSAVNKESTPSALGRSRGKEKHISSLRLQQMVTSIKETKVMQPLSPSITSNVPAVLPSTDITPRPASPTATRSTLRASNSSSSTAPLSSPGSDHSTLDTAASDTSAELLSCHSIVRGFSLNQVSSSYRSHTHLAPTSTAKVPMSKADKGKPSIFMLGGSSGEDESSFDDHMSSRPGQSVLSNGLKQAFNPKKHTTFKDVVDSRAISHKPHEDEEVFESSDEEEAAESAIDDEEQDEEDGSDWEDSSEVGEPLVNDKQLFQRVDSRPDLVSRRSLLTSLINQGDRAAAFKNMASMSTPALKRSRTSIPNAPAAGPSLGETPQQKGNPNWQNAKPITMSKPSPYQLALSPRATRRNMLAAEFTESLRANLLHERQQKSRTAHAAVKRAHTANDLTKLKGYSPKYLEAMDQASKINNNELYGRGLGEYHVAGW